MEKFWNTIKAFFESSGIAGFFQSGGWLNIIMIAVACVLLFLAIKKKFEPYLLLPIAFGMLLVNLPFVAKEIFAKGATEYNAISLASAAGITAQQSEYIFTQLGNVNGSFTSKEIYNLISASDFISNSGALFTEEVVSNIKVIYNSDYTGIFGYLYYGVKWGIYPCLIFLCIGATTDFGPLIANKKTMLLGAAAQLGIFITFIGAIVIGKNVLGWTQFDARIASAIGIIGGADGPTAILVTSKLAPEYLSSIAIVAYSYMALVPVIQPPIIRLLTTKKERAIKMETPREVSKTERILFPIIVTVITVLIVPSAAPFIG